MAIVRTDDTHYQAIADEIRLQRGNDNSKWLPETMPIGISTACMNQYNTGFSEGREDGFNEGMVAGKVEGRRAEYDRFWDALRTNLKNRAAAQAFSYYGWSDDMFEPNGTIECGWSANQMFYRSNLTDTKVAIDITGCGGNTVNMFEGSSIHTVCELIVTETTALQNTFASAANLANITIGGVIGKSINMQWCPLTADSIRSVVNALSATATGCAATFNKAAKEAAFTDDEWAALIANKPNWTFSLV